MSPRDRPARCPGMVRDPGSGKGSGRCRETVAVEHVAGSSGSGGLRAGSRSRSDRPAGPLAGAIRGAVSAAPRATSPSIPAAVAAAVPIDSRGPARGAGSPARGHGQPALDPDAAVGRASDRGIGPRRSGLPDTADRTPATRPTTVAPSAIGRRRARDSRCRRIPPPSARFDIPATLEQQEGQRQIRPGLRDPDRRRRVHLPVPQPDPVRVPGLRAGRPEPGPRHASDSPGSGSCSAAGSPSRSATSSRSPTASTPLDLLDVFLDFDFDPRLRIRLGRFKTPFTYEFFVEPIQGLILPERSLFFNNFGQNRDLGVMAFGRLFNNTLDYAVGIFNGTRNGYRRPHRLQVRLGVPQLEAVRRRGGLAARELQHRRLGLRRQRRHTLPVPQTLRTIVPTAGNAVAGVPFLAFNNNVRETGDADVLGPAHRLVLPAARRDRRVGRAASRTTPTTSNLAARTHLPVQSFYVQAGYLLTGETRSSVGHRQAAASVRALQAASSAWVPGS